MTSSEYQHFAFSATSVELNLKVLEMHKWNIQTDRVQRVDKKNCIICPFIMFNPKIMVMNISKMTHFCIFCWWQQKISHSLGKMFKCIWKNLFTSFRECHGLLGSELSLARCQSLKTQDFCIFCWFNSLFDISTLNIARTVTSKSLNHSFFLKDLNQIFKVHVKILPKLWIFCCHQ